MQTDDILDAIKAVLVERLKFDPARAAGITPDTLLPKGLDESLELDSLDFIELAMGIEERCGITIDEDEDLAPHFKSAGSLAEFVVARQAKA